MFLGRLSRTWIPRTIATAAPAPTDKLSGATPEASTFADPHRPPLVLMCLPHRGWSPTSGDGHITAALQRCGSHLPPRGIDSIISSDAQRLRLCDRRQVSRAASKYINYTQLVLIADSGRPVRNSANNLVSAADVDSLLVAEPVCEWRTSTRKDNTAAPPRPPKSPVRPD